MLFPPVPLPRVKSPPWHMNPGMTRWNAQSKGVSSIQLYGKIMIMIDVPCRGRDWFCFVKKSVIQTVESLNPNPFSPVQSARKFSAVLGTTSTLASMTQFDTRPELDFWKFMFQKKIEEKFSKIEKYFFANGVTIACAESVPDTV